MIRTLRFPRTRMLAAVVAATTLVVALLTVGAAAPATAAPAATVGVTAASPTVALGSTLTINFATTGSGFAKDWVALYSSGAIQSTCPSPATHWNYTSSGTQTAGSKAVPSGSMTFSTSGWALGSYSVYLCQNDGYTSIGTPITINVVTLATASTTVPQGSTLTFNYGAPAAQVSVTNWIGLYSAASGSTPGHGNSTFWDYVSTGGTTEPPTGTVALASGAFSFNTTGWPVGTYTAYFLYNDGDTGIGSPITISVVPPTPDVLNVDFASGAPVDHAQGLTPSTFGSPTVATDTALGEKVANFNGTSDAYQYDFTNQFSKLANHFSVECQFKWNGAAIPTGTSTWPSVCSGLQNGGMGLIVYNGKLDFELNVGGYKDIYAPIVPGVWYDAMATWNGATASIYLNGQLASSAAAAGALTLPTTTKKGWSLGADLSSSGAVEQFAPVSLGVARVFSAAMSADAVAAQYRITVPTNAVTVTRSGQGTATSSVSSALSGTKVTLSESPATGYSFAGWKVTAPTDGSVTIAADGSFTMPNVPVAVQATFAPHTYSIHFDGNDADGGTASDEAFTYDTTALITANPFSRSGFHFAGWAKTPDGAPLYSDAARVVNLSADDHGSVTLYAVWHGNVPVGASVPSADLLDVDFADGTPKDNAQNLAVTPVGTPTIASDPTLGKDVATFNGTTDAYQYDFSGSYPKLANGLTEECQFRWNSTTFPTGTSTWPSICNSEQSGGGGIMYYNGALQAELYVGGKYVDAIDPNPVTPGQWYDAIQTWDGANLNLYVDGVLVATAPATGALGLPQTTGNARPFNLGADLSSSGGVEQFAPVSLGSARIWSSALTAGQVTTQAKGTSPHDVTVTKSGSGTAVANPGSAWVQDEVALVQTPATGYSFTGWTVTQPTSGVAVGTDSSITMPDAAVAVQASFAAHTYAVNFDGNGADAGTMGGQSLTYDHPAVLASNTFARAGYYFAGWSTGPAELPTYADAASVVNLTSAADATVTLYAFWVPNGQFVVRASSTGHGNVTSSSLTAGPGDVVTLGNKPDTGYHFTGWQVVAPADGSVTVGADGTFAMPNEPVTVLGAFAANSYSVQFDGNGADDGTMKAESFLYGQSAALTASVFSRDGYVLSGWATTAGGPVVHADGATVSNLATDDGAAVTLYAIWTQLTTAAGSWSTLPSGFVTDTFHLPASGLSGSVNQQLVGLWNGSTPTSFTKVSGDDWLSVSSLGVVSGTAPSSEPDYAGEITVSATNGTTTSQILVEAPVAAAPEVQAASWNAWADGSNVTDAVGKNLQAIASRGIGVLSFQDGGAAMAMQVGAALGWHVYTSGDLGIVSTYPFTSAPRVGATATAPALAATVDVDGQNVRVWDAYLNESSTDAAASAALAQGIADAVQPDVLASPTTPVVLLGDLGSADLSSTLTATGLGDTWLEANPGSDASDGATWPVFPASASTATRVDYVLEAGTGLHLIDSDELSAGFPSATSPAGNSWASDHAAVVTTFTVGDSSSTPTRPVVSTSTSTVAYQVGHGPSSNAAFVSAAGATADPSDSSIVADLSSVDFSAAGTYAAQVYASNDGVLSVPVSVAVRVAPVPQLTLAKNVATFIASDTITQDAVLAQLAPAFVGDGPDTVSVDVSDIGGAGTYPVIVDATDKWGFSVTVNATVKVLPVYAVTVTATVGGTAKASVSQTVAGAPVTLSETPATGFSFDHWQSGDVTIDSSGSFTMPDSGVSIEAVFVANQYSIQYQLNGGTATGSNPAGYSVQSGPITLSNPTRAGYSFAGWMGPGHSTPSTAVTIPTGTTGNLSFAANWTLITNVIGYTLAGGSVATSNPTTYTVESGSITLTNPARYGYTFAGWTGTGLSVATKTVTIPTGSTGDRSYTANWTQAAPSWSAATVYSSAGTTVFYNGKLYVSLWYSKGEVPGSNPTGSWEEVGAPTSSPLGTFTGWTASQVYNGGETVVYNGKVYEATWYSRNTVPGAPSGPWEEIGLPVVTSKGTFTSWTTSWIYNGGETVAYNGHLWKARFYSLNLVPTASAYGAWQDLGAY
ncbi:MAG TPA: InlB B-repeat-containing protein [Galbitalea sp.]